MAEYAERDRRSLEPYYSRHVDAMTAEYLHNKSDIAAELAWRDKELVALREEAATLKAAMTSMIEGMDALSLIILEALPHE